MTTRGASKSFALPFDLDYIAPFYVIPAFGIGLERVLCGIKRSLDKASLSAPLVPILATLMLHFLEEWEVFAGLSNLLQRHGWVDREDSHLTTSTNMLLFLLDNHMVSQLPDQLSKKTSTLCSDNHYHDSMYVRNQQPMLYKG